MELGDIGVPIVPTALFQQGSEISAAIDALGAEHTGYIAKPIVGVGAFGITRFRDRLALVDTLSGAGSRDPLIVQPFLASVATEGEWSFVFGAGRFLYAALKTPRQGDYRVQVMYGAKTVGLRPEPDDLRVAMDCLEALPVVADIARIDMARMPSGGLVLMEAELSEPQLYFFDIPEAANRIADAVLTCARSA